MNQLAAQRYQNALPRSVRKARGVFYTPTYVTRYIVEQTLGPALVGRTFLRDLDDFTILDPSCGGGAFLVAAYEWLDAWAARSLRRPLMTLERQRLLRCIGGFDI